MDVVGWLRGLGLERYVPAFRDNDIDGEVLRRLTAEDLRELGIASIGHRRRLLDAIAQPAGRPSGIQPPGATFTAPEWGKTARPAANLAHRAGEIASRLARARAQALPGGN
jgi:hypothetical protein